MLLYRTSSGPVLRSDDSLFSLSEDWQTLVNDPRLADTLKRLRDSASVAAEEAVAEPLAPLCDSQELWASGVTYFRSRTARMEESKEAGGGDFYDRVYHAERPEIFFKATPHRVVGHGQAMTLRQDSQWIVPEPELVLVCASDATIVGYTVGNDLSCRDLEGENPLYLPQAKTFDRCASLGPAILIPENGPIDPESRVLLTIHRGGEAVFEGETTLSQMKRGHAELVDFLFRHNAHPHGVLLMTGTGTVPPEGFSLTSGDVVDITIDGIGTISNPME
ncbi:Fumarylacetoacetate (FAA) hydrolase family protein [Posidoniimonas polymericola]|uniref:Fumarylacetoacetate (FAA) hydrolase family protein n=1 Tax=Posidoniimonas polymericola TaxID=2528002 RepID=A0A5C5XX89_9BACT|nr:fumarylacetoacetate hydrolase family protein [Posidoniimonas polymericola]TWT66222.1 Fumarylacetoacetate (FAA) hydrolase family protein [Posidoniimonas polymericola]